MEHSDFKKLTRLNFIMKRPMTLHLLLMIEDENLYVDDAPIGIKIC